MTGQEREPLLHPTLSPPTYTDPSTSAEGIVANEVIHDALSVKSGEAHYGSLDNEIESEDNGYAVTDKELYVIMISLMMSVYLSSLDGTVVTTLLSTISSDLEALPRISWIATAYLLSCSAFQPLFGKFSDIFGRKAMLLFCNIAFTFGCVLCGCSNSLSTLVVGRIISGIGGGGLTSLATIAMSDLVPLRDRGLYQGIANCFFALGTMTGGYFGGLIADTMGWRWAFLIQTPLSLIAIVLLLIFFHLPEGSQGLGVQGYDIWGKLKKVDVLGSSLMVVSLTGIMMACSLGGRDIAYNSWTFILIVVVSLGLLFAFGYVEMYVAIEPTIPVRLLGIRTVLASSLSNWFFSISVFSFYFYIPLYLTSVMNLSPAQTGLRMVPNSLAVVGSLGAGYYMKKTGKYLKFHYICGLTSVFGVLRICFINPSISAFTQSTLMLVPNIGYSAILTITLLALISAVDPEFQASTTSIQYAFRSTGSTLGVSLGSSIFSKFLLVYLSSKVSEAGQASGVASETIEKVIERALLSAEYLNNGAPEWSIDAISFSYDIACRAVFWLSFIFIVLGYLSGCFMKEHKLHATMDRS